VSFDVFVQGFHRGGAAPLPSAPFRDVFGPSVVAQDDTFCRIKTPDGGEADIYVDASGELFDGFMMNHFSPGDVLDLLAEFVCRAGAVLILPGCPTCLASVEQAGHLPDELKPFGTVVIENGSDIDAAMKS
jgi:hypothetical protein